MRILFFLHYPNPFPGAAWRRIEFFSDYFRRNGHSVSIAGAFSLKTIRFAGSRKENGISLTNAIPIIMASNVLSAIFNIVSSFIVSLVIIAISRPDITIISVPSGEGGFGSFMAARLSNTKVVVDYRDEWEDYILGKSRPGLFRNFYKSLKTKMTACYRSSDMVIAVTENLRQTLQERGVKQANLITNGADTSLFKPHERSVIRDKIGINNGDFVLVYSGGVGLYYRIDFLIKALGRLDLKGVRLLILGDGPECETVSNLSKKLGMEGVVSLMGSKNKEELSEIISACDLGIIPYDGNVLWKNALPAKFFEYLSCGVPVLATVYKDSLIGQLVQENRIGYTSEPEDENGLEAVLNKIYNEKDTLTEMGKRARRFIEERFDRQKIANEFLHMLVSLNAEN